MSEREFVDFGDRFVRAAQAMQAGGWWWRGEASTARAMKRRVLREVLAAALFGKRRPAPAPLPDPALGQPQPVSAEEAPAGEAYARRIGSGQSVIGSSS